MATRKKPVTTPSTDPAAPADSVRSVSVNKLALNCIAFFGTPERSKTLFTLLRSAVVRLVPKKPRRGLKVPEKQGTLPSDHDIIRWLDSVESGSEDAGYIAQLYDVVQSRVPDAFRKSVIKGE